MACKCTLTTCVYWFSGVWRHFSFSIAMHFSIFIFSCHLKKKKKETKKTFR